ncbi:MAG: 50S ribosomal protein L3 [Spirochaetales bacterium]|nr:MAG: 50S ribosomal protein L3 [Spirochaetales bacterium]
MIGLIGKKIGMTQVFDEKGKLIPVTVVAVEPNSVVAERTMEKNGYSALVLGAFDKKEKHTTKPYKGQFKEGVSPKKELLEVRDFDGEHKVGETLGLDIFEGIRKVDVSGITKGKGFQGVVKRHKFGGGRKTHGSKFHNAIGSVGASAFPSRTMKGLKMPGRMGGENFTVQNIVLVKIDLEKKVLLLRGAVPGPRNSMVLIRRAKKSEG